MTEENKEIVEEKEVERHPIEKAKDERRIGAFLIPFEQFNGNTENVYSFLAHFLPIHVGAVKDEEQMLYVAFNQAFVSLMEGEKIPMYDIEFTEEGWQWNMSMQIPEEEKEGEDNKEEGGDDE